MLLAENITIERTESRPVFISPGTNLEACDYYRAVLPARMTGGVVRGVVEVALDGGPFRERSFHRADDGLLSAAAAGVADLFFYGCHPNDEEEDAANCPPGVYSYQGVKYTYGGQLPNFRDFHRGIAQFDVAIAPLITATAQDETGACFNACKSPQKWFEHSLHGTAMVLSDCPTYACVQHGVDGLKASGPRQFKDFIMRLCTDRALRERIAQGAFRSVTTRHTTACYGPLWRKALGVGDSPQAVTNPAVPSQALAFLPSGSTLRGGVPSRHKAQPAVAD